MKRKLYVCLKKKKIRNLGFVYVSLSVVAVRVLRKNIRKDNKAIQSVYYDCLFTFQTKKAIIENHQSVKKEAPIIPGVNFFSEKSNTN